MCYQKVDQEGCDWHFSPVGMQASQTSELLQPLVTINVNNVPKTRTLLYSNKLPFPGNVKFQTSIPSLHKANHN